MYYEKINNFAACFNPVFASCQNQQKKEAEPFKPNILFIYADDLGYHDLSCMDSDYYETPHIDRIAAGGMVFTNGYANCQVRSPSRASNMSGKFPPRHDKKRVRGYGILMKSQFILPDLFVL